MTLAKVPLLCQSAAEWALKVIDILKGHPSSSPDPLNAYSGEPLHGLVLAVLHSFHGSEYPDELAKLIDRAHKIMTTCHPRDVPFEARRLYSDAALLWSLLDLAAGDKPLVPQSELFWEDCVNRLDHAIIIAGAPGRLNIILDLIEKIQLCYLPLHVSNYLKCTPPEYIQLTPRKIPKLKTVRATLVEFTSPPSFPKFQAQLSQSPFVLRGFTSDWPALSNHPWASKDYLLQVAGRGRVVPVEVGDDYRSENWTQKLKSWKTFLDDLFESSDSPDSHCPIVYLAQYDLFRQFPALRSDVIVPDYVYVSLPPPSHLPEYRPPNNDENLSLNVWFGPKGATSPAHTDPYFNFYTQVVGRKTIWLAPPSCSPSMTEPIDARDMSSNPALNNLNPMLSNTTQFDVFNDASSTHPTFGDKIQPFALTTVLEPGDSMFIPAGWWHALRSEDTSLSVSMWF